ncbi:hypothetical protein V7S43_017992 [Phytophthora oleae]|uniref:Transposase IS891/IS1136/IS1341 domain-containing protein n=1 Tax=Phytophthora oleae TaxID=2107226 RepID=A0ABD3EVP5_9STRA
MLSISKVKNIAIRCDPGLVITNEIQITNENGFWYAVIPQFVRPHEYSNHGRMIALDPGMKTFMTGVDLDGNALHVGRDTRPHLDKYRARIRDSQREMDLIKKSKGHRSGRQWRAFARAKRTFHCATAKLKNSVKELHYQTCAHLTKHYDTNVLTVLTLRGETSTPPSTFSGSSARDLWQSTRCTNNERLYFETSGYSEYRQS